MEDFYHITIGELVEIKKIGRMKIKEALFAMRELRDKHKFTDKQTTNLYYLARNFNSIPYV